MKKYWCSIAILSCFYASGSYAKIQPQNDHQKICQQFYVLANGVMTARQNGVSKAKVYRVAEGAGNRTATQFTKNLIDVAYKSPVMANEKSKQAAIKNFAGQAQAVCMRSLK